MSIKNQHGIALMTVIMFLFLLSLTWLSFSFINSYENDVLQKQVTSEQASYVAEAGIQQALYFLSQDWNWQSWANNKWGNGGTLITDGALKYYQWSGNLGDSNQTYTVKIIKDDNILNKDRPIIRSKVSSEGKVGSFSKRTIEVELGSAFDFGLYSYGYDQTDKMDFRGSFTVSGDKQTGYVYAKQEILSPANLHADKITGNYQNAPAPYYFLPKEIPLPHPAVFRATIYGTPTSTSIPYTNETGEESPGLASGKHLFNTKKGKFRTILSVDKSTNTIITQNSPDDGWANGDEIIDDYCQAKAQELLLSSGPTEFPSDPYDGKSFPEQPTSTIADFTAPPVSFSGDTTFLKDKKIKIRGDATFSGNTIINGDIVVDGTATFSNALTVNGHLYVTGSLLATQNLTTGTGGEIIVSGDININQITGSGPNSPLFIATTLGNLTINTLGPPFYGLVYAGGDISSNGSININGGNIIANKCSLNSGSITNKDMKSNLSALGFTDSKDFVRPLVWMDTTE
jgi:cytoskeletal protein CcmA (bactofilin family)